MKMAETLALQNERALQRFNKAIPAVFPGTVLTHALARRWTPPTPRLAVDSYWRSHPLRADRIARALAAKSGTPGGWTWRLRADGEEDLPVSFRTPPAPYREEKHSRGPGYCCLCGQPVYRLGWHTDLWDRGPNDRAVWHTACVVAWQLWNAPSDHARLLRKVQGGRCAASGARLWKTSEVDHRTPLFRVWREHRDVAWPQLLNFWGIPNLQVINRDAHAEKSAAEASTRRRGAVPIQA
jgi:hypothetical protein